ncbi:MAG: AAA family ATPase [Helicobacteraceae bacterium]|jgi:superfamily I DNA and/or RNA helicase|nr:AAA family ATPase [Helicobacteraceae bacterium]
MAYLLLNFAGNSDSGSARVQDFYNKPLKEQYETLTTRYSQLKRFGYEQFIQACFPVGEQRDYYISMPNFIREGYENAETNFFNNIVIRATRNAASEYVLPNGLEVILIGDVSIKYDALIVKGIELIDGAIYKRGEMKIYATAACAFTTRSSLANGRTVRVPEYGFNLSQNTSAITRDLMLTMCQRNYAVSDPKVALDVYYKWSNYLAFRKYYLAEQGKDRIPFDKCEAIKCYVVSKRDYQSNLEKYDEHILDNLESIRKDEQIIVTKRFDNSDPFELIRVTIDKNKKELFSDLVKGKPTFEQKLWRFTRKDISLENARKQRVLVGERYKLYSDDIEPDYSGVEKDFQSDLEKAYAEIDDRYSAALKRRIAEYMEKRTAELTGLDEATLAADAKELADNLARDVSENNDVAIRREIKAKEDAYKAREAKVKFQYKWEIFVVKKNEENRKDNEVAEKVKKLEDELANELAGFAAEIARQKDAISLRALYEARNKKLIAQKEANLKATRIATLSRNKEEKHREINAEYEPIIRDEKQAAERKNANDLAAKKADMKENLTIRRYYVYFELFSNNTLDRVNEDIKRYAPKFLKFDQSAESAKIDRQKNSLQDFFGGCVKNPFLSTYLFAPRELGKSVTQPPEVEYFSPRLNEKQKEAVRKALASESIFLLQGPPGTGKTEVIAEIAAQFVKRGKRILISSETHKAIDNVFERLPKIPEIRPLRLIPSQSNKEQSPYSPERLTDNFYINISDRLAKEVERFEHFSANKEKFGDDYKALQIERAKLDKEKERIQSVDISLERIKRERESLVERYDVENEKLRQLQDEIDTLQRRLRNIAGFNFVSDDDTFIKTKGDEILIKTLAAYPVLKQDLQTLGFIYKADIAKLREEIASLASNSELVSLEAQKAKIKEEIAELSDPDTEEIISGKEAEHESLRAEFIAVGNSIKAVKNHTGVDISELSIGKIVNRADLEADILKSLPSILLEIKGKSVEFVAKAREEIGGEIDAKTNEINAQKGVIGNLKGKIRDKDNEAQTEKENGDYEDYKAIESGLKRKITEFFEKFDIVKPYEDIATALDIIRDEWNELERNYTAREAENRENIPMYKRILKFLQELQGDGAIENDRMAYAKKLFENVNVFGLTCTSRNNFETGKMESFKKYALDDLDVKKQGIDVVIIDEVSKSSFLDLLIPILYGKTVILVGDHRQLPPMYDLRNMRADDFDGLDPNIIDWRKNDEYSKLYEECFFKTLFESVPDRLRVTLTKQYRCHEDIMKAFNHFYGDSMGRGSLELGTPNQNDQKQHDLLIKGKSGRPIIERDKHIYFVDCSDSYDEFGESTSATNETEARVIIELAKKIDEAYERAGGFEVNKSRGKDTRMSMGVICTYGAQARRINHKLRNNPLKNICELYDDRFIISTVDDFQGDERDIIFVSMVRNPEPKMKARTRAEFVKKFERINVALSRARRLLIVVGAKDFLSEAAIDLPDMSGNRALDRHAYQIYKEIIGTIAVRGLLLKASDVLGEDR